MSSLIDLLKAIDRRDLATIRELANPDVIYDGGVLPIACKSGDVEVVRCLLEVANYRECYSQYAPEAFVAMRNGDLEMFRLLCEYGLDPNATEYSKHGLTLFQCAVEERRVEIVRLLVKQGDYWGTVWEESMDVELMADERESEQLPPEIELAARAGDVGFVEFMLEVGVEMNGQDASYYLKKAQQNAPKFQQIKRAKEEVEAEQRSAREVASQRGNACVWSCIGLILGPLALIGLLYRIMVWVGWEAVSFACAFVSLIYVVMRISRWGRA